MVPGVHMDFINSRASNYEKISISHAPTIVLVINIVFALTLKLDEILKQPGVNREQVLTLCGDYLKEMTETCCKRLTSYLSDHLQQVPNKIPRNSIL